ncbi:MAG TPA: hypothetical protein PKC23_04710 [Candidatus Desulfobacillus sp.]|mgnify:CR=1 FL=1|nr:hypothetical protein [Candidatus Desulfobacillus sp.]
MERPPPNETEPPPRESWYHQPLVWIGIVLFVASVAGSVWLIAVSSQAEDEHVPAGDKVFGVPTRSTQPASAPR